MADADYLLALELQKQLNEENLDNNSEIEEVSFKVPAPSKAPLGLRNNRENQDKDYLNQTQNLVHPEWEVLDPTPDIFTLFGAFDGKFFQNKLKCVTLEWSKKMYSCAGICYSRRNRFGMAITIRLSEPLLKLRPRKNLVETMLHEMIHAYCFVLNIREGNGGHGPNFKKIMNAINQVAGTNITVYHTFHDEVELYKQHVWRCNGICQHRAPFFGYVKRTSNRAPGPNDQWWAGHKESCGGYFQKIQEPEKKKKVSSKKIEAKPAGTGDLRKYFDSTKKPSSTITKPNNSDNVKGLGDMFRGIKGPIKTNGGGTLLLNPKTKSGSNSTEDSGSIAKAFPPTSYPGLSSDPLNTNSFKKPTRAPGGGNLSNVIGFRDLTQSDSGSGNAGRAVSGFPTSTVGGMVGKGYSLDSNESTDKAANVLSTEGQVDRKHLRDIWAKRFDKTESRTNATDSQETSGDAKRRRISSENALLDTDDDVVFIADETKPVKTAWSVVDDDLMVREEPNEIISLSSDEDSDEKDAQYDDFSSPLPMQRRVHMSVDERQTMIKQEILDDTDDLNDEDIVLIDDEYDEAQDVLNISAAVELADTSLIDEFFGEDTLLKEFKNENDVIPSGSRYKPNPDNDIVTCPICQEKLQRKLINEHLDGCTGIVNKVKPPVRFIKNHPMPEARKGSGRSRPRKSKKQILKDAGYTEEDLLNITSSSAEDEDFLNNSRTEQPSPSTDNRLKTARQKNLYKKSRECPICFEEIADSLIQQHVEECLENSRKIKRKSTK